MKTIAFFIPIFKYKVKNWNIKKEQLLDLFYSHQPKIVDNVITSPFNIKTSILSEEIELFEKEIGVNLLSTECWFQKYDRNMDHVVHNHGPMGFSSVCFIEYNKNIHKPTTFISPFSDCVTGLFEKYEPDVQEGDIIFFPSNLLHYAPTNLSDQTRIIISFNLRINRKNKNFGGLYS